MICNQPFDLGTNGSLLLDKCHEHVIFSWLPSCVFLFSSIFWVHMLRKHTYYKIKTSWLLITKLVLIFILILNRIASSVQLYWNQHESLNISLISTSILIICFVIGGLVTYYEKRKGLPSSGLMFTFWLFLLLGSFVSLHSIISENMKHSNMLIYMEVNVTYSVLLLIALVLSCLTEKHELIEKVETAAIKYFPILRVSVLNRFSYSWMAGVIMRSNKVTLKEDDLWSVPSDYCALQVSEKLEKVWNKKANEHLRETSDSKSPEDVKFLKEKNSSKLKKPPSLMFALCRVFGVKILFTTFLRLVRDLLVVSSAIVLGKLIKYIKSGAQSIELGIFYALTLLVITSSHQIIFHQFFARAFSIGLRMKVSLMSIIYKKGINLSNQSRKESTVGQMVNLIAINAHIFTELPTHFNNVVSSCLTILFTMFLLWRQLGVASLAGVTVILTVIPLTSFFTNASKKYQIKRLKYQDSRVKTLNELLNGIKVVKFYAWELSFKKLIDKIRSSELGLLRTISFLGGFTSFTLNITPFMVSVASFGTFILINDQELLDAERAFVSLTLFNSLKQSILNMPNTLSTLIQANVSLSRISTFLLKEEINTDDITHQRLPENSITVENCKFGWSQSEIFFNDLSLAVRKGELLGVVGKVGSGKSSLLNALIGEMSKISGKANIEGRIAYAPQQPWIRNATIRDNILFGKEYNEHLYKKCIELCCLKADLDQFPSRDLTEVGEKGINLSGGQKQRISLARCVYTDADIYLLDDTLSAVDSHVGKRIFDGVIGPNGILSQKTRIFVTNALNFLPQTDRVMLIENGQLLGKVDNYDNQLENNPVFREFLREYLDSVEKNAKNVQEEEARMMERSLSRDSRSEHTRPSSMNREPDNDAKAIIEKEQMQTGKVKRSVFMSYFRACNINMIMLFIGLYVLGSLLQIVANFWLSKLSDKSVASSDKYADFGIYVLLGFVNCILVFAADFLFVIIYVNAAQKLHQSMLGSILKCTMQFFESTPVGRILNRFSKDVDVTETRIPDMFKTSVRSTLWVVSVLVVICFNTPVFIIFLVPIFCFYFFVQRYYTCYSRQVKRMESVSRSPIYAFFAESLSGSSTIRAFRMEQQFVDQMNFHLDRNLRLHFHDMFGNRWLGYRLELTATLVIFFSTLLVVFNRHSLTPGIAGLTISYALSITQSLTHMVRTLADFETNIVSVERIEEYCDSSRHEDEWVKKEMDEEWPQDGQIQFKDYSVKYREDLDFVLKDLNFKIGTGEKIGIVGRTGAGKSTLTLALFRILEPNAGQILIDHVDIKQIGLHSLRQKLTIIPQDPVIFSGTLRNNLDPFNEYTDEQVWSSLERAHLKEFVMSLDSKLEFECTEGGENLSVGQRQLICLARALLKKTKILVLDEATAAIDYNTDGLIQSTIREQFADCTILTIAHRLNTIMDSDRILVFQRGRVLEFDSPTNLLANRKSSFYSMAREAGLVN